jgi:hypothetical protein
VRNNIIISTIIGLFLSFLMMYISWKHNSQSEIYSEDVIHFSYWLTIGITWFILGFIVTYLFIYILKSLGLKL